MGTETLVSPACRDCINLGIHTDGGGEPTRIECLKNAFEIFAGFREVTGLPTETIDGIPPCGGFKFQKRLEKTPVSPIPEWK